MPTDQHTPAPPREPRWKSLTPRALKDWVKRQARADLRDVVMAKDLTPTPYKPKTTLRVVPGDRASVRRFCHEHEELRRQWPRCASYLDNGYRAMLAELDGQIVGHVWWFDPRWEGVRVHPHLIRYDLALEPGQVWSFDLYLLPQHRGGGASNDFFALFREHLRSLGYTRVFGHVDATNTPAVWLHKVQGYKPVKTVEARLYGRLLLWSGGRLLVKNPPFIVTQKFDFHPLW